MVLLGAEPEQEGLLLQHDQQKISVFERNPIRTLLAVSLITMIVIDVVLSTGYKMVMGYPFYQHEQRTRQALMDLKNAERVYRIKSEIYHHDFKPEYSIADAIWGSRRYAFATDSRGFKSAQVGKTELVPDGKRIVFIGDSFTEGIGLPYSDTFIGKVAAELEQSNTQVLNAAVASYSPIIYWRKLKYLLEEQGFKLDELVVFLDISDIQDEAMFYTLSEEGAVVDRKAKGEQRKEAEQLEIQNLAREKRQQTWGNQDGVFKSIIKNNSIIIFSALSVLNDWINGANVASPVDPSNRPKNIETAEQMTRRVKQIQQHDRIRSRWTIDEKYYNEYGKAGVEQALHYMDKLFVLLERHKVKLTLAVYPWPEQIINNDLQSRQVKIWGGWANSHQVPFLNYFPCFIDANGSERRNRKVLDDWFIPADVHWNPEGHTKIAQEYLKHYRTQTDICH